MTNICIDFLNALYGGCEGPLSFIHDDQAHIIDGTPKEFIDQHPNARVGWNGSGGVPYIYAVMDTSEPEHWKRSGLTPTAVIHNGETMISFWAFKSAAKDDDPIVIRLINQFEMQKSEYIPLPTGDWVSRQCNIEVLYTLEQLADAFLDDNETDSGSVKKYGDADIITPYNENDYERSIIVTIGSKRDSKSWKPQPMPLAALIGKLCQHQVGQKDGLSLVFADMVPGQRLKNSVRTVTAIGLDIDTGTPTAVIDTALAKLKCLAVRYSTHSNNKTVTEFKKDKVLNKYPDAEIDTDLMRQFCSTIEHWDQTIVDTIEFVEEDHTEKGIVVRINHMKMPKHRVIVPLKEPYEIAKEGKTQLEATAKWAQYPAALAALLGVPFDRSCTDPSRLYYLPRHDKGKDFDISLFGGPEFDRKELQLGDEYASLVAELSKKGGKSKTEEGKKLGRWSMATAHGFQIANALEAHAPDKLRGSASMGFNIECPFDEDHSNPDDPSDRACFVVNAAEGGNELFIISCRHETCRDKTNLDMLGKMIKDGWFEREVLDDPNLNVARSDDESGMEILPTLAELKERVAALAEDAVPEVWRTVMEAIEHARLKPADAATAHKALKARCRITTQVYDAEVADFKRGKKRQEKEITRQGPKGPDEKTLARSDKLAAKLVATFGKTFSIPSVSYCGPLHLDLIDDKPWLMETYKDDDGNDRARALCTPFTLDGVVTYPDRNFDEALRLRLLRVDGTLAAVEFDAETLGQYSGSEVTGRMFAKGWRSFEPGRKFALDYFKSRQLHGPKVYHRPGFRDGIFVLATGDVIAPKDAIETGVELHTDSRLKGPFKAGTLDEWKRGAAHLFSKSASDDDDNAPAEAWHFQLGAVLGLVGPVLGYLGLDSMSAYIDGATTKGKTTMQMLAAGNWATPDIGGGGLMLTASATPNGMESSLERGSCAVLCYDEIARMSPEHQYNLIFMVQGATGKQRMAKEGGDRLTRQWTGLCLVTSAEVPLGQRLRGASVQIAAGMTARVLPITVSNAKRLEGNDWKAVEAMLVNYGHSGPALCSALLDMDPEKIRNRLAVIIDSMPGTTGESSALRRRAAQNAAYVQIAAEVAEQAGLIPVGYDAATLVRKVWKDFLASDIAPVDPAERALEALRHSLITRKGVDVIAFDERAYARSREALAYHSARVGEKSIYVIPAKNLPLLSGGGADPQAVKNLLDSRGYLMRKDDRMTWKRFPGLGEIGCIILDAAKVDASDRTSAADEVEFEV